MRGPIRKLALPVLLVGAVAGISLGLFGFSGRAQASAGSGGGGQTTSSAPTPGGTAHSLGNTGGTRYGDTELSQPPAVGKQMFVQSCASCHGADAQGTARAPTLVGLGTAAVDFWVRTGRMPLAVPAEQAIRRNPLFSPAQAGQIADYVGSLGSGGPSIPSVTDLSGADLQKGGELFRLDCATCHSFLGVGGALSYGAYAPSLYPDKAIDIAEAIRVGPGNMPRFSTNRLSPKDEKDIIRYVTYIVHPDDRGGFNLSHVGPTTEGLVGIVFGVGLLMLAAFWIGDRA